MSTSDFMQESVKNWEQGTNVPRILLSGATGLVLRRRPAG